MRKQEYKGKGHRKRLRERFIKTGLSGFHDHEILELLLTYALPQKDTKPIAKDLLENFGSLIDVLNADIEDLKKIPGVKEYSAVFIKFTREFTTKYFQWNIPKQTIFSSIDQLYAYLCPYYHGKKSEIFKIFYLDNKNGRIHEENFGEGTVNEAVAFPRKIVESALRHSAASVIIAHNHPGGLLEPSERDNKITKDILQALETVDVTLQEHIIVNEEGYYSFRQYGFFHSV